MSKNGFYFRFDESHDRKWVTHAVNISGRDGHVINALIMMLHKQLTWLVGDILLNKIILRICYTTCLFNLKQHYIENDLFIIWI